MERLTGHFELDVRTLDALLGVERCFDMIARDLVAGGRRCRLYVVDGYGDDAVLERMIGFWLALPSTADAAGINVTKYKYLATCIGSMIAGLGGLYYVMDYANGVWSNNAFGDRGWLAIALVIFTIWRPNVSILASILFGGLYILNIYLPTGTQMAVKELYKMLPYAITLVVLIIVSLRKKREDQPPASLGLSYFREER